MKHGDLSNEIAPGVGIRFENIIKTEEGVLNKAAKSYLEVLSGVDVMIYVLTTGEERKTMAFLYKWAVPYNKVLAVDSLFEIADVCREQKFISYYDVDRDVLHNVRSRGQQRTAAEYWDQYEDV